MSGPTAGYSDQSDPVGEFDGHEWYACRKDIPVRLPTQPASRLDELLCHCRVCGSLSLNRVSRSRLPVAWDPRSLTIHLVLRTTGEWLDQIGRFATFSTATTASTSGFSRAVLQAIAVVTTLTFSFNGRNTTFSGASFFSDAGTSAMPWPQPTNAT